MKARGCTRAWAAQYTVLAVFLTSATGAAWAESNLEVHSISDCPNSEMVKTALLNLRPEQAWEHLAVTIATVEDRVQIQLEGEPARWREVPVPTDCADRAQRVAFVIAVWSGELPTEATSAPSLSVAVPAPSQIAAARPKRSAMLTEVGLSGFYSMVGGVAPGGRAELAGFTADGRWGLRASLAYQSTKSRRVDIGASDYSRTLVGAALVLRRDRRRIFFSTDCGFWGAFTRAHGDGYSQNESASGLNLGLALGGRVGLRLGVFRIWTDALVSRWLAKETIRVDPLSAGPSTISTLPSWDVQLGLGGGVEFH